MGSLCICIKEPALDNQMILTTASQSQYRNYTSPHIDDKPISQRYTNYNTISKSLTTQVFPFKKNFLENPIDEDPETARTKVSSVRNSNTYFKEDFSFTSNSKSISKDNQRLIVPIVDQNSKITTKIRVRNKEIFISNDIVSHLNEDDVIYEVEAQKENTHNLPKRSRLYQGIIDSKLLPPGVVDFNLLNEVLIVLIMPFDLFGYGLYRYTFHMRCEEVPELKLNDGATRIFLNTRGIHPELVSPELIELLKYMEHSTDEVSEVCKSERIQKMHRRICQIKASEKTEVKYMQSWEEKILIKQEGIAEGEQIGRSKEKTEFVKKLSNKFSIEQIAEMLEIDISEVEKTIKEIAK